MKNFCFALLLLSLFIGCGGGSDRDESKKHDEIKDQKKETKKGPIDPVIQKLNNNSMVEAASRGDLNKVKEMIEENSVDVNVLRFGSSALLEAATGGHSDVAEYLLSKGADVNQKSSLGTPLVRAAVNKNEEMARLFLKQDQIDINGTDEKGKSALEWALILDAPTIAHLLLTHKNPPSIQGSGGPESNLICKAAFFGRADIMDLLLQLGADVNARNEKGETPLMLAIHYGRKEVVALLDKIPTVQVNAQNDLGQTSLFYSANKNDYDLTKSLLSKGADAKIKDNKGLTAAASVSEDNIAELLCGAGAPLGDLRADIRGRLILKGIFHGFSK